MKSNFISNLISLISAEIKRFFKNIHIQGQIQIKVAPKRKLPPRSKRVAKNGL